MSGKAFETKLNVFLGKILSKEIGLHATSETISSQKRPDVILFVNGLKIVIEGSYSKLDAEKDIEGRIKEGIADLGIAVYYKAQYPANVTDSELENFVRNSTFETKIVIPEDISETLLTYKIKSDYAM
jgi:hypothetical protein